MMLFRRRLERSVAVERLQRLERTDPMMNGAQRLNDWNIWNRIVRSADAPFTFFILFNIVHY